MMDIQPREGTLAHLVYDPDPDTDEVLLKEFLRINRAQQRMHREAHARIDRQCWHSIAIAVILLLVATGVWLAPSSLRGEKVTLGEVEQTNVIVTTDRRDGW
jgi:hypothetical protein